MSCRAQINSVDTHPTRKMLTGVRWRTSTNNVSSVSLGNPNGCQSLLNDHVHQWAQYRDVRQWDCRGERFEGVSPAVHLKTSPNPSERRQGDWQWLIRVIRPTTRANAWKEDQRPHTSVTESLVVFVFSLRIARSARGKQECSFWYCCDNDKMLSVTILLRPSNQVVRENGPNGTIPMNSSVVLCELNTRSSQRQSFNLTISSFFQPARLLDCSGFEGDSPTASPCPSNNYIQRKWSKFFQSQRTNQAEV